MVCKHKGTLLSLSIFLAIGVISPLSARHIIGGEITYICQGEGNSPDTRNYQFVMNIYRDCSSNGAPFDNPAELGIYRRTIGGSWEYVETLTVRINTSFPIDPTRDNPCLIVPPDICVEEATYVFEVFNLPVIDQEYMVAYRRCCRNNSINNIIDPGGSGATYSVTITPAAQQLCNSSPIFNDFPPIVICAEEDINFDHSASDAEGDQLVYEFCSPLLGGGNRGSFENPGSERACDGITPDPAECPPPFFPVNFIVPTYSPTAPMAGDPVVSINPITGRISGVPEILGQFVVGVCVTEFRDGVELSRIQRDFQFNVAFCEQSVFAGISADSMLTTRLFQINSCGSQTVNFENQSGNINFIDSYIWEMLIDGDTVRQTTRDATYEFPDIGNYQGQMIVNPGTDCSDTAFIDVNIFPEIIASFDFDYDTCIAGPVDFTDLSSTGADSLVRWLWTFGDGNSSSEPSPSHLYESPGFQDVMLTVVDNNRCSDDSVATIQYQPAPAIIVLEPDRFVGCAPGDIFFNNLSTPIDSTYDILWDFGDGNMSDEISPTNFYEEPGIYSISIDVTSPIGCMISAQFQDYIRVLPGPIAAFTFDPANPTSFNSLVQFTDLSTDAINWQWFFGDESVSFDQNPSYNFRDTGVQEIILVVGHESGCTDSAFATLDIQPIVNYYLPNAFSPNNDGINDTYRGIGAIEDIVQFELTIWNRWGEKVFETNDPNEGWNGRKNNVGVDAPLGVYSVIVQYTEPRGKAVTLEGIATLIR